MNARRGHRLPASLAPAVAACAAVCAAAAAQTTAPAPPSRGADAQLAKAFREADACLGQLERLRAMGGEKAETVRHVVDSGLAVLDEADRAATAQLRHLEANEPPEDPKRPPAPVREPPAVRALRVHRCRLMLLKARLCTAAGEVLPARHADRDKLLRTAIETCRWLRIEFRALPLAAMGYLGEAKARRLLGDAEGAAAALECVPGKPAGESDPAARQLYLAAALERLHVRRLAGPKRAVGYAQRWLASGELADEPLWRGRARWALARFVVDELTSPTRTSLPGEREIARAAALLRGEEVVRAAPPFARLEVLARLDELAGGKCLTTDELLAWARLLAAAGRREAGGTHARLWARPRRPLPPRDMLTYASLLWQQRDYLAVADVCDVFLRRFAPAHERSNAAIQLRAAALLKARDRCGHVIPAALRSRLSSALAVAVESALADDVRRDALRQWVDLRLGAGAPVGEMLTRHADLVAGDAYLLYADVGRRWSRLTERIAAEKLTDGQARETARRILARLAAAGGAARAARMPSLAARCALLGARLLAGSPLADRRGALASLNAQWALLRGQKDTTMPAAWLRVEMMMHLGMLDGADAALGEIRKAGDVDRTEVSLRLAEMLARRYPELEPIEAGRLRRRVLGLCGEFLAGALGDATKYNRAAPRAARTMMNVAAHVDAELFLSRLLEGPKRPVDRDLLLGCSLLLAEALRKNRKAGEAAKLLEKVADSHPRSPEVFLAAGRCQMELYRPAQAVEAFRKGRKLSRRGSGVWCRLTLALGEGLRAAGHEAAAEDVLRVAQALDPDFGGAELRAQLIRTRESLRKAVGSR